MRSLYRRARISNNMTTNQTQRKIDCGSMAAQVYARKLTPKFKERIHSAQEVKLNFNTCCSTTLLRTVESHADAIGAPKEYIFFPLLTIIASFMGVNAKMNVNQEWSEPAILWSVVAARKGEKKTAALKRLMNIVEVSFLVASLKCIFCFLQVSLAEANYHNN